MISENDVGNLNKKQLQEQRFVEIGREMKYLLGR